MSMFLLPHYYKSHLCTWATRLPLSVARRRGETRRPSYSNTQFRYLDVQKDIENYTIIIQHNINTVHP